MCPVAYVYCVCHVYCMYCVSREGVRGWGDRGGGGRWGQDCGGGGGGELTVQVSTLPLIASVYSYILHLLNLGKHGLQGQTGGILPRAIILIVLVFKCFFCEISE